MNKKIIDDIVWWIPFKKLRNAVRELLLYNLETRNLYSDINCRCNDIENNINYNNNEISIIKEIILKKYYLESMIYQVQLLGEPYYFYDSITSRTVYYVTR
ncbi:hypothetical protein [Brachyspira sp.]|uniref:hypothetical protein n=1 Tax=Brachyspira sp. TaxID=1977261 RepID=UPI0026108CD4|nr:hypothetical protein [Brachyspira sp.]